MKICLAFLFIFSISALGSRIQLSNILSSSTEIQILSTDHSEGVWNKINRPVNSWRPILKLTTLNNTFSQGSFCLYFFVPFDGEVGKISLNNQSNCTEFPKTIGLEILGVKEFSYRLGETILSLKINSSQLDYTLFNRKSEISVKRFDQFSRSKIGILSLTGKLSSNIKTEKLNEGDACHIYGTNCSEEITNFCYRCPSGVIPVLSEKCPFKFNYYCSSKFCGQKNNFACVLGVRPPANDICSFTSEVATCKQGLSTSCNEKKEIVCL